MPSMDDLIALIGRPIDSPAIRAFLATNPCEVGGPIPGAVNEVDLFCRKAGIALRYRDLGEPKTTPNRIETIFLHLEAREGFEAFTGELSRGLRKDHGPDDVRALWGTPTRSRIPSGRLGLRWDRYDLATVCIHLEYRADQAGIRMVTLMSPDTAP